jgi:hypothetical protein
MSELKEKEAAIGAQLSQITPETTRYDDKPFGACTKCSDGKLVILRSKKLVNALWAAQTILKANVTHVSVAANWNR